MGKKQFPKGVKPRTDSIQIYFRPPEEADYVYETFDWRPNKTNIARAGRLRAEIVEKIRHGIFNYAEYFPDSPRARGANATFGDFAQMWLDSPAYVRTQDSRNKYLSILERIWMPSLAKRLPRLITSGMVLDVLGQATREFREVYAREIGQSTYNDWLLCVRGVFAMAVFYDAIKHNDDPTQKLKNRRREQPDPQPFEMDEADRIIARVYRDCGPMWGAWFELGFYSGMRCPSEAAGLTWGAVDFGRGNLRIHQIMTKTGLQKHTKTHKERTVKLNSRTRHALLAVRPLTDHGGFEDVVFVGDKGGHAFKNKHQERIWRRTLDALGIRYRNMYNMRHTFATFGIMAGGKPGYLANQLGHSLAEFFKTYARWINGKEDDAQADILESAIGVQAGKTGSVAVPLKVVSIKGG